VAPERDPLPEAEPDGDDELDADDLVGRSEALRERAEELEEEERELEQLEQAPREWLAEEEKHEWSSLEPHAEESDDD
jgi:hypothetical protein